MASNTAKITVTDQARDDAPIFVVGRDRAAVGRLAGLITAHSRLGAVPSSGLLGDLAAAAERNRSGLAAFGYPEQHWFRSVAGLVESLHAGHVALAGKARWVDCPPWGSPSVEVIDRLFPRAQVVHVTGAARFRGGSGRRSARSRQALGPGRYLEVGVADLARAPAGCAALVWEFLGEQTDDQDILGAEFPNSWDFCAQNAAA